MLVGSSQLDYDELFRKLWREIFQFERAFSRFVPASELSMFNKNAGLPTKVTAAFLGLLLASEQMSQRTRGLHNPFILPSLQRTGYYRSAQPGYETDVIDDFRHRKTVLPEALDIADDIVTIPHGSAIDMGGCGKGYLLDQLSKTLSPAQLDGYWLSLSGDMLTYGNDEAGEPWRVEIQSSSGENELPAIQTDGMITAIATSGTFRRAPHKKNDTNWHHIIDPRTGFSAETDVKLATVVADSALVADTLASSAVIVGDLKARLLLEADKSVRGYVLQTTRGIVRSNDVFTAKRMGSYVA